MFPNDSSHATKWSSISSGFPPAFNQAGKIHDAFSSNVRRLHNQIRMWCSISWSDNPAQSQATNRKCVSDESGAFLIHSNASLLYRCGSSCRARLTTILLCCERAIDASSNSTKRGWHPLVIPNRPTEPHVLRAWKRENHSVGPTWPLCLAPDKA